MPPELDLGRLTQAVDEVLDLVRNRLPEVEPAIRDWNDRLMVAAFARAYRCLRSVRELTHRAESEDAAVLTRALVSLTLQYLWLVRTDEAAAAEMLGLALVPFATLLDVSEPILRHGLTEGVAEIVSAAHRG